MTPESEGLFFGDKNDKRVQFELYAIQKSVELMLY